MHQILHILHSAWTDKYQKKKRWREIKEISILSIAWYIGVTAAGFEFSFVNRRPSEPGVQILDARHSHLTQLDIHSLRVGWRNFFPVVL
jgi:hypothetical protein